MIADTRLVIDACVVVKWFVDEEHFTPARFIRDSEINLIAPALVLPEVGNVLLKKIKEGDVDTADAVGVLANIPSLLTVVTLLEDYQYAFTIALGNQSTFYDSLYVALAIQEGCRFVTADLKMFNALRRALPDTMLWIGDCR